MPRKANAAFMAPLKLSDDLAAVVSQGRMPRSEIVSKMWVYIKKHGLQDSKNKRNINADEKLKKVFGGKSMVNMFEMAKHISNNVSKAA